MKATVLYGPRDIRLETLDDPKILKPADAILRLAASCVCGSDLWPYRGAQPIENPTPMGHEYCGVVEEVGSAVKNVKKGQFVIGSFATSDNTCPHCRHGYPSSCVNREFMLGAQAPLLRVPQADGTLVATKEHPSAELIPSLLAVSDVLGTGWFPADGVSLDGAKLFFAHVHLHGGPAPVRRCLPQLIDLVLNGKINPGKVFDLTLPLAKVAEGYKAMDERRAIKTLLTV